MDMMSTAVDGSAMALATATHFEPAAPAAAQQQDAAAQFSGHIMLLDIDGNSSEQRLSPSPPGSPEEPSPAPSAESPSAAGSQHPQPQSEQSELEGGTEPHMKPAGSFTPASDYTDKAERTLFFARVSPAAPAEHIARAFACCGGVEEVNLFRAWPTAKASKGCGLVVMSSSAAASKAINALHLKLTWQGADGPMVVERCEPSKLGVKAACAAASKAVKAALAHRRAAGPGGAPLPPPLPHALAGQQRQVGQPAWLAEPAAQLAVAPGQLAVQLVPQAPGQQQHLQQLQQRAVQQQAQGPVPLQGGVPYGLSPAHHSEPLAAVAGGGAGVSGVQSLLLSAGSGCDGLHSGSLMFYSAPHCGLAQQGQAGAGGAGGSCPLPRAFGVPSGMQVQPAAAAAVWPDIMMGAGPALGFAAPQAEPTAPQQVGGFPYADTLWEAQAAPTYYMGPSGVMAQAQAPTAMQDVAAATQLLMQQHQQHQHQPPPHLEMPPPPPQQQQRQALGAAQPAGGPTSAGGGCGGGAVAMAVTQQDLLAISGHLQTLQLLSGATLSLEAGAPGGAGGSRPGGDQTLFVIISGTPPQMQSASTLIGQLVRNG